jgi:hypothetical protein
MHINLLIRLSVDGDIAANVACEQGKGTIDNR